MQIRGVIEGAGRERRVTVLCAALGVAGVVLVLAVTGRYGAGLSQDSVDYVAAARNLLAGNGYLTHEGRPFVLWGPLLPTLLAAWVALFGVAALAPVAAWMVRNQQVTGRWTGRRLPSDTAM